MDLGRGDINMDKKLLYLRIRRIVIIGLIIFIIVYTFFPTGVFGLKKISKDDISYISVGYFADDYVDYAMFTIDDKETIGELYDIISGIRLRRKMILEFPESINHNIEIVLYDAGKQVLASFAINRPEMIYLYPKDKSYIVYNKSLLDDAYSVINQYYHTLSEPITFFE